MYIDPKDAINRLEDLIIDLKTEYSWENDHPTVELLQQSKLLWHNKLKTQERLKQSTVEEDSNVCSSLQLAR